jgi:hypothetical protein
MRKIALLAMLIILMLNCSKNKTTNPGISVYIDPYRALVTYDSTFHFSATVNGTNDKEVTWRANNIIGGDSTYGLIDNLGNYTAPSISASGIDSVKITARLVSDTTKSGNGWAVLVDPSLIYVQMTGSDSAGTGSLYKPYRTITKALTRAGLNQTVLIGAGEYNAAAGEAFPLRVPTGVYLHGAGSDSTYITGPGGMNPFSDAALRVDGDAITIEGLNIRSTSSLGVGIWLRPGNFTKIQHNQISNDYIGIYVNGGAIARPIIANNVIRNDSIGIVTADTCRPIIRQNAITNCHKFGVYILNVSLPDLGTNDSTFAGGNRIDSCGDYQYHWLIYNGTSNVIWAVGNNWPLPIPEDNDQFIYDNEESGGSSGAVMLREP